MLLLMLDGCLPSVAKVFTRGKLEYFRSTVWKYQVQLLQGVYCPYSAMVIGCGKILSEDNEVLI